jgi:hypothetical protein
MPDDVPLNMIEWLYEGSLPRYQAALHTLAANCFNLAGRARVAALKHHLRIMLI